MRSHFLQIHDKGRPTRQRVLPRIRDGALLSQSPPRQNSPNESAHTSFSPIVGPTVANISPFTSALKHPMFPTVFDYTRE